MTIRCSLSSCYVHGAVLGAAGGRARPLCLEGRASGREGLPVPGATGPRTCPREPDLGDRERAVLARPPTPAVGFSAGPCPAHSPPFQRRRVTGRTGIEQSRSRPDLNGL